MEASCRHRAEATWFPLERHKELDIVESKKSVLSELVTVTALSLLGEGCWLV